MIEKITLNNHSVLLVTLHGNSCPLIYRDARADKIIEILSNALKCDVIVIYDDVVKNIQIVDPAIL